MNPESGSETYPPGWEKVARRVWKHRGKVIAALVMVLLLATVGGLALKVSHDERLRREAEYAPIIEGARRVVRSWSL